MHTGRPKARVALMLWCLAVSAGAVAACGSTGSGENRLVVNTFGDFGYRELYTRYEQSHPGLKIVERVVSYDDHHKNLQAHLLAGSGTGDVEAVDGGYIALFKAWSDKFVDFKAYGADPNQWLAWKSQQATASGGKLMGLGTDIGGLAMCYRSDLFAKAGLPSNRDAVAALWPDWRSYIETGKRFKATAPNDVAWFDSGANLFNAIIGQASVAYVDSTNKVVVGSNPAVKQAYDLAVEAVQAGESAKLSTFSQQWNAGFQRGSFATVTCPAWMTDTIKLNAPGTNGKWDIATIPGGSGNWGGSYLAIPKRAKNPKAAWTYIKEMQSPAGQLAHFLSQGSLPTTPSVYSDPQLVGRTDPFFSNAPIGKIYTQSVVGIKPFYIGPQDATIGNELLNTLTSVEQGKVA